MFKLLAVFWDYQVPVLPLTILQPLAFGAPVVSHVRDTVPSD